MKNLNRIEKLAWSFHKLTGMDYSECLSAAGLAYAECLLKYDASKNSFSSFSYKCIKNALVDTYREEKKWKRISVLEIDKMDKGYEKSETIEDFIIGLPKECRALALFICEHMDEIPDDLPPIWIRGQLRELLKKEGWKMRSIWNSFRAMKKVLS